MTAQALLQGRIDAQQRLDALVYALRSVKVVGSLNGYGAHARQIIDGQLAAAVVLRGDREQWRAMDAHWLRVAKDQATEELKAAKAALKDFGGVRQLRLALATGDAHEFGLAA
jgi:hypothetical protein